MPKPNGARPPALTDPTLPTADGPMPRVCGPPPNSPPHVGPAPIIPPRDAAVPASCSISPKPLDGFWLLADATLASNGNSPADRPEKLLIVPIFWPVRFSALLSLNSPSPYAPSVPSRCAVPPTGKASGGESECTV